MGTSIQITVPISMGKPWSISEKTGQLSYVRIAKTDDSATVIFEAANHYALVRTRVDNAIRSHRVPRFNIGIPAKLLRAMKPYKSSFKGAPWRYSINLHPDQPGDNFALVSFGDGMSVRGYLGNPPRLPSFEGLVPDIAKIDEWEPSATPRRATDDERLVSTVGAMTRISREVQIYLPGGLDQPMVLRKFREGVGSRSTAVIMPTLGSW